MVEHTLKSVSLKQSEGKRTAMVECVCGSSEEVDTGRSWKLAVDTWIANHLREEPAPKPKKAKKRKTDQEWDVMTGKTVVDDEPQIEEPE